MAKVAYADPGYTIATLLTKLGNTLNWDVSDASGTNATKVFQAVTAAGLAACTWKGERWWWLEDTAYFQTRKLTIAASTGAARSSNVVTITTTAVHGLQAGQTVKVACTDDATYDGTFKVATVPATTTLTYAQVADDDSGDGGGSVYVMSYPLRGIDVTGAATSTDANKVAWKGWAPEKVYYTDDWALQPITWRRWRLNARLLETTGAAKPYAYAVNGEEPYIYVWPAPSAAYDIFMDFIKRHSLLTGGMSGSEDEALIVPAEFQEGIYVHGAAWLLRHDTTDEESLRDCPGFMEAIGRMRDAAPHQYDQNPHDLYPDVVGGLPHDRRIIHTSDGFLVQDDVSV